MITDILKEKKKNLEAELKENMKGELWTRKKDMLELAQMYKPKKKKQEYKF